MKKPPQQRKPKAEMEPKRKRKDKKKEEVGQKESKSRQKKEAAKIAGDGKKKVTRRRLGETGRKSKGEDVVEEEVNKRTKTKTKRGTPVPEDKKKRSRNKMENGSSAAAGDDEEGVTAFCSFPMSRVRRLMRLEGGNCNVVCGISSDAVFLVNKASEMFLEKFVDDSYGRGMKMQKKSLNYKDLSSTVHSRKKYEFLSDFVPEKLRSEDALKARTAMET